MYRPYSLPNCLACYIFLSLYDSIADSYAIHISSSGHAPPHAAPAVLVHMPNAQKTH